ncbi:MAG: NAD-dependent epimerase/dehydratase family protein [Luteitalea sp.]|nr:NAD-dependent epimerase/dehydratase family protein [Luteitalea sp.]
MKILITGAAGFLGNRLVNALLSGSDSLSAVSTIVTADSTACPTEDPRVDCRTGTIIDPAFIHAIVERDVDVVYHLAAVVSGQAEAEFDLGMQVNVDGTRYLLEACRCLPHAPRFIFVSTAAVFGGRLPDVLPEDIALAPESSYGAEKAIAEILVNEYSRRGFIDGVICRLATIAVRPGKPNAAASSFVSGIVREPLAGIDSLCPVPLDTRLWVCSPEVVIQNLVHAARLPTSALEGRRALNLPGLCVTPLEMLDSLERLGGAEARARVRCELDQRLMRIVCSWPGAFDISRPLSLGFRVDSDIDSIVRQFIAEQRF